MIKNGIVKSHIFFLFLLFITSLPILLPLLHQGFFQSDDGEWMIIRFSAFHQALRDGQIPVRWLGRLNNEYGYPVANFLYPGFMYLAEIFKIAGFGFIHSIKVVLILSIIFSGFFTYGWLSRSFDKVSAFVGAVFYLYAPYHLYDLYKRGSVGEMLALAVFPFVLWQLERKSLVWFSLGFAFLLISHNILSLLFSFFIIAFVSVSIIASKNKKRQIFEYGKMLCIGAGLSSFFWIPAIYDLQFTVFSKTPVANWREYFVTTELVGYSVLVVLLSIIFSILYRWASFKKNSKVIIVFIFTITSLFLASSLSFSVWELLPGSYVQFPFRFLSITIISASFLTAFLLSTLSKRYRIIAGLLFLIMTIYFAKPFMEPVSYINTNDGYYATNMDTTTVHNEYMPYWVKTVPISRPTTKVMSSHGEIHNLIEKSNRVTFQSRSSQATVATINIIYFPGWKAYIDTKETEIHYKNDKGIIQVNIPSGVHEVKIYYSETPLRLLSDILSLGFLFGLLGLLILENRYNKK